MSAASPEPRSRGRALLFSALLVVLVLGVVELALSVLYFQRYSAHPLAILQALHTARVLLHRPQPVGIWQTDPRYGYVHVPGARGTHRTPDFVAVYTIGPDGDRVMPAAGGRSGEILLLGGSYTFGHGVDDDQSYAARLAAGPWSQWSLRNRAVMGWGTAQAWLALQDRLVEEPPPALVVYAMIDAHVERNSIRASWVETLTAYDRLHPHFELSGGKLELRGVVDASRARPDSPELRATELALTAAFLREMREACARAGVPLVVAMLDDGWSVAVVRVLVESGLPLLDLSGVPIEGFESDVHPNPRDHARLAAAIDDSFVGRWIARGGGPLELSEASPARVGR